MKWVEKQGGIKGKINDDCIRDQIKYHLITNQAMPIHYMPIFFFLHTAMQENSATKSKMVFDVIANSNDFYHLPVSQGSRSRTNVPFRVGPDESREKLEAEFLAEASSLGLLQLKGHRSVGGIRASLYNAMMPNEVERLTTFMKEFMEKRKN